MAILKVFTFPDPVLKQPAKPVEKFDRELAAFAGDMLETMYDAPGVGLAANQVGELKRIVVIDTDYDIEGEDEGIRKYVGKNPRVLVNPVITARHGELVFKEGCLSVPDFTEEVKRSERVTAKYQDLTGKEETIEADGLLAVCIQHELDHLDGKLFIDRLSIVKRNLIKNKLRKDRARTVKPKSRFHVEL
jgi:peptide deformylase